MKYSELKQLVILHSGQYLLDIEDYGLTDESLMTIVKSELSKYSKWMPLEKTGSFSLFQGKVFSEESDGVVPNIITEIRRVPSEGQPSQISSMFSNGSMWCEFDYRKPALVYLSMRPGVYQLRYVSDRSITRLPNGDYEIEAEGQEFISLVTARFMMTIGRMGRSFEVGEFPFSMNSDQLLSEGQDLYDRTMESIKETSNWHLAILT